MQNSPFPGMDPYLEKKWPEVHARLIVYAANQLNRQLAADLHANIEETLSVESGDERANIRPDVHIQDEGDIPVAESEPDSVAVAEPLLVARQKHPERHIEIVHESGRVITAIEIISPWNKIGSRGRENYTRKQNAYLASGINLVEIDLVRRGRYILGADLEESLLDGVPYWICVFRREVADQFEVYRVPIQEQLPNIPIPLRLGERDAILQLQLLINDCYRDGRYRFDYQSDPDPPFTGELAKWVDKQLRESKRRS